MAKTVITPVFRLSYPALAKPVSFQGNEPMYSCVMLFEKTADLKALKQLAKEAIETKWPDAAKRPKNLKHPFRDGDTEKPDTDGYAGCFFVSAKSRQKPGCVYANKTIVPAELIEQDLYAGCYCRAVLTAYAYDTAGNRGVAFGLQHIQKVRDGEAFSGRIKVEDAFDVIEGEDDPFASEAGTADNFM